MKSDKRPKIRPVPQVSIEDKVFTPIFGGAKRVPRTTAHRLVVLADLQRGSLKSLNKYLARHEGIPDPEVAVALRELISGHYPAAKFRIVVGEHPDAPKNKGGRPRTRNRHPTPTETEYADAFEALAPFGEDAALFAVAEEKQRKESTVLKAVKFVRAYRQREAQAAAEMARLQEVSRKLSERRKKALTYPKDPKDAAD